VPLLSVPVLLPVPVLPSAMVLLSVSPRAVVPVLVSVLLPVPVWLPASVPALPVERTMAQGVRRGGGAW
jgi:hypothetical protein